ARLQARSCGETATLTCYGGSSGGTSQNLNTDDISYAGAYVRYLADTAGNPLWTMPSEVDCSEWSLPIYDAGTVLALVKHISPRSNSSISYYDIARTIDGLERDGATKSSTPSLLTSCATNGGQLGIVADTTNEVYSSASYKASKAVPSGLIVKLVRA
ncbi:hypothetical protein FB567DRAFT_415622, partial [Paraphoma chrysanthemicola]